MDIIFNIRFIINTLRKAALPLRASLLLLYERSGNHNAKPNHHYEAQIYPLCDCTGVFTVRTLRLTSLFLLTQEVGDVISPRSFAI
jgi:hypothetical protein